MPLFPQFSESRETLARGRNVLSWVLRERISGTAACSAEGRKGPTSQMRHSDLLDKASTSYWAAHAEQMSKAGDIERVALGMAKDWKRV